MNFDENSTLKKKRFIKFLLLIYFYFKQIFSYVYLIIYYNDLKRKISNVLSTSDRIFDFRFRYSYASASLKYFEIIKLIFKNNFNYFIECGSGRSTLVIDHFCSLKKINFLSFEENKKYYTQVLEQIENKKNLNLVNVEKINNENKIYVNYLNIREYLPNNIDIFYIDGPVIDNKQESKNKYICNDIFVLLKHEIFPPLIVIDGRYDTVEKLFMNKYIKNNYNFHPNFFLSLYMNYKIPKKLLFHSYFVKKNLNINI